MSTIHSSASLGALGDYRLDRLLTSDELTVSYRAWELVHDAPVVVTEYFPSAWAQRQGELVVPNDQGLMPSPDEALPNFAWGLEQFLAEARALAQLRHPHVAHVQAHFAANGTAYAVTEALDGDTLGTLLEREGTLEAPVLVPLLYQSLLGLAAIHAQGLLHWDINPETLYWRRDGGGVVITGTAAARQRLGRARAVVSQLLNPGYSAPEQYAVRGDRCGAWTDLYALGAVAYRCITGEPPQEAADRILDDALASVAEVGRGRYPRALLQAVDRALALERRRRFANALQMAAAMEASGEAGFWEAEEEAPVAGEPSGMGPHPGHSREPTLAGEDFGATRGARDDGLGSPTIDWGSATQPAVRGYDWGYDWSPPSPSQRRQRREPALGDEGGDDPEASPRRPRHSARLRPRVTRRATLQTVDWGGVMDQVVISGVFYLGLWAAAAGTVYLANLEDQAEPLTGRLPRYVLSVQGAPGAVERQPVEGFTPDPNAPEEASGRGVDHAQADTGEVQQPPPGGVSTAAPLTALVDDAPRFTDADADRDGEAPLSRGVPPAETAPAAAALDPAAAAQVDRWLERAEVSLERFRLTTPAADSALHYYEQVLQLDPDNAPAQRGFTRIAVRYAELAQRQMNRANYPKALDFIEVGLAIKPGFEPLLQLQSEALAELENWRGGGLRAPRTPPDGRRETPRAEVDFDVNLKEN
ncbi:MAG: protein kinase [Candidatus Competibacterales bacterium]